MSDTQDRPVRDQPGVDAGVLNGILLGLTHAKKSLPSTLLYDATGSGLFQQITELPEYYLTRTEKQLLESHAAEVVSALPDEAGCSRALVEFGASDECKAIALLDATGARFAAYLAIDISPSVLGPIVQRMQVSHPKIQVETLVADFSRPLTLPRDFVGMVMVGFLPGSTVGQVSPEAAVQLLDNVRQALTGVGRAAFVLGIDQCRDAGRVLPAYDDSAGVSRAFNLNLVSTINRLTGSDLEVTRFERTVLWNAVEERVEMYLVSRVSQTVRILGHSIGFAEGERIQIGVSHKYGMERFLAIATAAGWRSTGYWQDSEKLFGIHLLEAG